MGRAEYYVRPDGSESTDRAADAHIVDPGDVAHAWLASTRRLPVQIAIGAGAHESNFAVNEHDVEANEHETWGLFQVDRDDQWLRAKAPTSDPLTIEGGVAIFAGALLYYLPKLFDAIDAFNSANGLQPIDRLAPPPDIWAYLAIAHNQGLGNALATIRRYGLDWHGYRERNAGEAWASIIPYGDDWISGGNKWRDEYASPFDDGGAPIAAPTIEPDTAARLRLALVALLALLLVYAALARAPGKALI